MSPYVFPSNSEWFRSELGWTRYRPFQLELSILIGFWSEKWEKFPTVWQVLYSQNSNQFHSVLLSICGAQTRPQVLCCIGKQSICWIEGSTWIWHVYWQYKHNWYRNRNYLGLTQPGHVESWHHPWSPSFLLSPYNSILSPSASCHAIASSPLLKYQAGELNKALLPSRQMSKYPTLQYFTVSHQIWSDLVRIGQIWSDSN